MNDYCFDIDLEINPLRNNIAIHEIPCTGIWTFVDVPTYINPELINFFNSRNLSLIQAALFTRSETTPGCIHIDGKYPADKVKMNWSYNGDHLMNWYKVKNSKDTSASLKGDRAYIEYDPEEVELIHSQQVNNPSIVQVGIPHSITNIKGVRKCLSIILVNKISGKSTTMLQAKSLFRDITKSQNAIL